MCTPWVRDVRTGEVRRYLPGSDHVAAIVRPFGAAFWWDVPHRGVCGEAERPDLAKKAADNALREEGYLLLDAPAGCQMEHS